MPIILILDMYVYFWFKSFYNNESLIDSKLKINFLLFIYLFFYHIIFKYVVTRRKKYDISRASHMPSTSTHNKNKIKHKECFLK